MCVGVVTPPSVSQSASSTSWYITHTILTDSLRSITVNLTTVISTQQPSDPLSNPHIRRTTIIRETPRVPQRRPTGFSNWTKEICAVVPNRTTQNIDAVISRSAFTEGLAAVQGWKNEHDKSSIPLHTNIKLYTEVRGVPKTRNQVSKSDSDIESLTLSLWHWVSDIECLILSVWYWVSDIGSLTLSLWQWVSDTESRTLSLRHRLTSTWEIGVHQHLRDACR